MTEALSERTQLLANYLKKSSFLCFVLLGLGICGWSRIDSEADKSPNAPTQVLSTGYQGLTVPTPVVCDHRPHETEVDRSAVNNPGKTAEIGSQLASQPSLQASDVSNYAVINMLPSIARPLEFADLSAPTDGALVTLNVTEGDKVEAGALLAATDDRITAASYRVAEASAAREASLAVAKAKQTLAEQYLVRITQTFSENAASGLELDEARSRLEEARATLLEGHELKREAVARLELEQARLNDHKLTAPFSGTVIRIKKHVGETLGRSDILMTLVNLSRLRAELYVPVTYIEHFPCGSVAQLLAALPSEKLLQATVVHVDPVIDAATNTIRIVVEIDNSTEELPAGFAIRLVDPTALPKPGTPTSSSEN